ncbi:tetrapyrrole biosynthesis, uroporphyrinogen III synthase [Calocera cornea HHB12733]|uniref:Tetrapyrrole biosynthesis, uroporphyrinogen III synthase n=1 Tax=Calocera cornea HHB12733 TaxID=1353952 RepID=A0A165EF48_9BASI|nr:tetrapyrrole biosynthesis, uroporphyrinogen III synthase [Calocera cornea HHB12733]
MRQKAVLVLKSPSTNDASLDPYYNTLSERGYSAYFIPVLEDAFCNESDLDSTLLAGPSTVSGVIVTSGRAVKAWESSVQRIMSSRATSRTSGWDRIPFYAVGPKTAEQMRSMATAHDFEPSLCPSIVLGDEASGTGERLAHFLVEDVAKRGKPHPSQSMLYLTGDKVSDKIRSILVQAGILVTSLQVYETRSSSTFESDLNVLLRTFADDEELSWVTFFSPSGARTALPSLRRLYQLSTTDDVATNHTGPHVAAIGPTTASFLQDSCKLVVGAVAQKPDPLALADAISAFDGRHDAPVS